MPKTNVFKQRSVRDRQGNPATKTLSSRLFLALKIPKTRMNRRTFGS